MSQRNIVDLIMDDYEKRYGVPMIVESQYISKIEQASRTFKPDFFRAMWLNYLDDFKGDADITKFLWNSSLNKYARVTRARQLARQQKGSSILYTCENFNCFVEGRDSLGDCPYAVYWDTKKMDGDPPDVLEKPCPYIGSC